MQALNQVWTEPTEMPSATKPVPNASHARLKAYVLTDMLAIVAGFAAALLLASAVNALFIGYPEGPIAGFDTPRLLSILVISACVLMRFQHRSVYRVRMNQWAEAQIVLSTFALAMLADGFFQFAGKNDFSRLWLVSGWAFAALFVLVLRYAYRQNMRAQGFWDIRTLLIGSGETARAMCDALKAEPGLGYVVVAQVDSLPEMFLKAGRSWRRLCTENQAEYVIVALDGAAFDQAAAQIAQLTRENIAFSIAPPRHQLPILDMSPQYFFNQDIELLTYSSGLEQPLPRAIKRGFDLMVASALLLILSPAILIISLLIARDGGAVFYRHPRVGKNGTMFGCYKFRSMVRDSDAVLARFLTENLDAREEWAADHKLKHDPRITRFGHFLRRSSLDELPQLLNVLKGEMSLVGPRPIVTAEIAKYGNDIAHYYRVSPGITGLWQVSGRNDVTYEQRVRMDGWYVRNWSLWHDIAILCKTIPALLNRSGAY